MTGKTHNVWQRGAKALGTALLVGGFVAAGSSQAQVNIADSPLFLTTSVPPNVLFILDDSGSMMWETLPDELTFRFNTGAAATWMKWVFPRIDNLHGGGDYVTNSANSRTVRFTGNLAAQARSAHINRMYYDPSVTYRPWVNADGTEFANANPEAAPNRPLFPGFDVRNLTQDDSWNGRWWNDGGGFTTANLTFYPATYYYYDGVGDDSLEASYTRVEIRPSNAPFTGQGRENRSDCANAGATPPSCTYAEEIQNFANWYTYHRNRVFASRAGISRAFAGFDDRMRVGYGTINHGAGGTQTVDGVAGRTVLRGVRPFSGADKDTFFNDLFMRPIPTTGTPLRRALEGAGEYFSRSDNRGPWSTTPGVNTAGETSSSHLTCRQSFSILMTDGYTTGNPWGNAQPVGAGRRQNTDGTTDQNTTNIHPDDPALNYTYDPTDPFMDLMSNNLADVAMYYWKRDLRPDLANRVPTSTRNEAFWQHMVTYGVGLGVVGSIDPADAWAAVAAGTPIDWPDPEWGFMNCGDSPNVRACAPRVDDLLHAAINARGGFFSVDNAEDFAEELTDVLADIVARVETSGSAAATSSAVLQTDTLLYTASFRSTDWSGNLEAREVGSDGVAGALKWNAEEKLAVTDPTNRKIFSQTGAGAGIPLVWASLDASQQAALSAPAPSVHSTAATGQNRLEWLRGVDISGLRSRTPPGGTGSIRRIGDLVNSDPQFMFKRDFGYSLLSGAEGTSYKTFRNSAPYNTRPDVLFVASNGGMLHAFHAGTPFSGSPPAMSPDGGKELFAYVPSELLLPRAGGTDSHAQINELMIPDYAHRYFVDGTPAVGDAYWGGSWKTVLVGTMGVGGRTVFALDVTDPGAFNQTKVLWEFGYADADCVSGVTACREVGYGITQPTIGRLSDGTWVAIFGNGYNSASQRARLFVVNLQTGQLIHDIDTGVGSAANPNGLAPAIVTDWSGTDLNAGRAYAGDLQGNLWRFSLAPSSFTATRLFSATDNGGQPQPITARPSVALKPGNPQQAVVLVGTGAFFRAGDDDTTAPQVQTLYGVFDTIAGKSNVARTNLTQQNITTNGSTVTLNGNVYAAGTLRFLSQNPVGADGWRVDLPGLGERVVSETTFPSGARQSRVRFTTLIPDPDPCGTGRGGFLMDIDLLSGGRSANSVFDLSGDGVVDDGDLVGDNVVSGIAGTRGERITVIRKADSPIDFMYAGDGTKVVDGASESGPLGRQSWRQLR